MHRLPYSAVADIIEWDVLNWARLIQAWQPVLPRYDPATSRVLAIGERGGGLSLWFALNGYEVICTDRLGPTPEARALHRRYNVDHRITYAGADVFQMPFPEASFDIVVCKSVVGGLKQVYADAATRTLASHTLAVRRIHELLKPGGCWLDAENMKAGWIHQWLRRCLKGERIGWRHIDIGEWPILLAPFARFELTYFGVLPSNLPIHSLNRLAFLVNRCLSPLVPDR